MDFKNFSTSPDSPSVDQVSITPNDGADLLSPVSSLYVGVSGNVTLVGAKGNTVTFVGVPGGTILPVAVVRVLATGTTATNLIGLSIGILRATYSLFIPLGSDRLITSGGHVFYSVGQ